MASRIQLEWRAKGHAAVGGTDVIDVARIAAGAVLGIDQVNDVIEGSRLTPALVPPVAADIGKHAGEVTGQKSRPVRESSGRCRCWPSDTAVS